MTRKRILIFKIDQLVSCEKIDEMKKQIQNDVKNGVVFIGGNVEYDVVEIDQRDGIELLKTFHI